MICRLKVTLSCLIKLNCWLKIDESVFFQNIFFPLLSGGLSPLGPCMKNKYLSLVSLNLPTDFMFKPNQVKKKVIKKKSISWLIQKCNIIYYYNKKIT